MASTRNLKKELNYLTGELLAECVIFEQFHPETIEHSDQVMTDIVEKRNELITRINSAKKLDDHKEIRKEFDQIRNEIAELVLQLDNLGAEGGTPEGKKSSKKTKKEEPESQKEEPKSEEPAEESKGSPGEETGEGPANEEKKEE